MTAESTAVVEREVRIAARPEIVFGLLTDAEQMLRWQGVEAELEPRPGGVYRVKLTTLGQCTAGRFVEVVPHSRIVFTWGWDPPIYPIPEGSTTVEITLQPEDGGTILHLRHTGLPNVPEVAQSHGDGWQHYLDRLAMFAEGRELPPDPWRDGAMS
ncbi:MAG: SRPBCC family protein [Chloroflexota bacterium]